MRSQNYTYQIELDMPPSLPKHVLICGHKVKVQMFSDPHLYGCYHNGVIQINPELCGTHEMMRLTLFHEMSHAVLDLTGQADVLGCQRREEGIVKALENLLPAWDKTGL